MFTMRCTQENLRAHHQHAWLWKRASSTPTARRSSTGDAHYMAPGHDRVVAEDSLIIEFSPVGEYQRTMAEYGCDE
ncbi:MAG: hypothetical protein ACRDKG_08780 [Actinomycetota bacterium]